MSLLAIAGFDHLPKNTPDWLNYRPDFINAYIAGTRNDRINPDGWLYRSGTGDAIAQFDMAKVNNPASTVTWISWKMRIIAGGSTPSSEYLILLDTVQNPGVTPSRQIQFLASANILPGYASDKQYQIDVRIDRANFTFAVFVDGVSAATGSLAAGVRSYVTSGAYFICPYLRQGSTATQFGIKNLVVYDNVNNGDGVNDYLGLIDVDRANIVSAESVTPGDWTPVVGGDTLLQGITKPIETANTGVTTVKTTALDVGISLTVPNTKRIRGIGFLTSSKTTSGGTPLHENFGGVTGVPIAQKTTLTHGQRSKIFTADPNGFIWTEETANAAKLSIIAG